jgi:hypothetical protein
MADFIIPVGATVIVLCTVVWVLWLRKHVDS